MQGVDLSKIRGGRRGQQRVAQAVAALNLAHVVVTSVDRDDLSDGGAEHFAATERKVDAVQHPGSPDVPPLPAHLAPAGSFEYLKTQAVSRLYLDNVDHIQSSWVTQGMKVGQVALQFGTDDMGSVMIEENVVSAAGTTYRTSTDELVHLIRSLGKIPVQRDTLYRDVRVFN